MTVTPERAAFVRQEFRSVSNGPVTAVVAAYGESARRSTEPVETLFVHQADAQAKCDERMVLLSPSRRRMLQKVEGETVGMNLTYTTGSPTAQVIDRERGIDHPARISEFGMNFSDETTTLESWGGA